MRIRSTQLKQKYEQQLEQTRQSCEEMVRSRFQKSKVSMGTICQKKDLHFMISSFMRGDIFSQDILNQFWDHYFGETAIMSQIVKTYVNGIISLLQKIVENNLKIYDLGKEKEKHKQHHDIRYLSGIGLEIEQITIETNQYINDIRQLGKPFDIDLSGFVDKYNPFKMKDKIIVGGGEEKMVNQAAILGNVFDAMQRQEIERLAMIEKQKDQLKLQEKYYRFVVYLSVVIFIGDLSQCLSKYNFVDVSYFLLQLTTSLLLLLNSLLEHYLVENDPFEEKLNYLTINYAETKIAVQEGQLAIFSFKVYRENEKSREHRFEKYTYSSICLMTVAIIVDSLWLLLLKDQFYYEKGPSNPLLLSESMWKYNHYVVYASLVTLCFKILILFLLSRIVDFQPNKLISRFNFTMNFIRFTNLPYITDMMKIYE